MAVIGSQAIRPRSWSVDRVEATSVDHGPGPETAAADVDQVLAHLEEHVVGQRRALRELGLLLQMHRSLPAGSLTPNALLMGPTGSGKSHTLRHASAVMGVPYTSVDASSLVPAGIVGEQVEDVLESLVVDADRILAGVGGRRRRDADIELAERGIIVLDEFDKLAGVDELATSSGQAEKRVVQRRLLKVLEGARLRVGVKRHGDLRPERTIDTGGILVLASGAFTGLGRFEPVYAAGPSLEGGSGVNPSDLEDLGFLPEIVGRLPIIITFEQLTATDLVGILDHAQVTPLGAWRMFLEGAFGASLHLDEAAKWIIAERAAALGLGARGLQRVLFPVMAAKVRELQGAGGRRAVTLQVADFMPALTSILVGLPIQ